ncbi:hypothetical protein QWY16_17610 [Planococcus shenhongbingii]|uniref:hypothetical protein n=1 Tax=Planococcus shenhongbingii TaxID=3058398 RepID=UPI0026342491|nr:hypothetical protein [Planococcus sp. N016]WKA58292.1 hypothetical protein QWY16_17610 [Planococcus sp. N016]
MKKVISIVIACIFLLIITLVGCTGNSNNHEGEAKTPSGSSIQQGKDYKEVVNEFKEKGFKNIETEKVEDLVTGWLTKDGEVESVSVDGDNAYSPDDWYADTVKVVITYHTFPSEEEKPEPTSSNEEEPQKENNGEAAIAALEAIFPVENAKRSAVVAITNGYAIDVFEEDGNTYDISKFHSYADTSSNVDDYFMKVNSWGTWSTKDEKTWHVDSLILENSFGVIANAALDVNFDGTNYVVSNINGTFGNPGISAENLLDLSDIATGSNIPYLTVSAELIKKDR